MSEPKLDLSRFSFGITSAIVTSMALMLGLNQTRDPRTSIVGALLLIAIADNVADSLGLHVYRESVPGASGTHWMYIVSNFATRLGVMMLFIVLVSLLSLTYAIIVSIIVGLTMLAVMSYYIAVYQKVSPARAVVQHLGIAAVVILLSHFLGVMIGDLFHA